MSDIENLIADFNSEDNNSLKISLEKIDGIPNCVCVYLNGYIDTYNSAFFQKKIQKIISTGFFKIIFNCSSLNYISSTGIGAFTAFLKITKNYEGDIVLLEIQPKVFEAFRLLGFSKFFNTKETMSDAIAFFKSNTNLGSEIFPKVFSCPVCSKRLKATKQGRFRCSQCKSILAIDTEGQISIG